VRCIGCARRVGLSHSLRVCKFKRCGASWSHRIDGGAPNAVLRQLCPSSDRDPLHVKPIDAFDGSGIEASRVWRFNTSNERFQTRITGGFCGLGVVDDTRRTGTRAAARRPKRGRGHRNDPQTTDPDSHRPRGCLPFLLVGHCLIRYCLRIDFLQPGTAPASSYIVDHRTSEGHHCGGTFPLCQP
jgi:hypothetical protein